MVIKKELIQEGIEEKKLFCFFEDPVNIRMMELFINKEKIKNIIYERKISLIELQLKNISYKLEHTSGIRFIDIPKVLTCEETLQEELVNNKSMARLGDGELALALNIHGCGFQNVSENLTQRLREILKSDTDKVVIGLHDGFGNLDRYTEEYKETLRWQVTSSLLRRETIYPLLNMSKTYGNAYVTRPWSTTHNEVWSEKIFELVRAIWERKDIILLALGPTATVLAYDLGRNGCWSF